MSRVRALQQEKSLQWEACVLQLESSPHSPQLEKSLSSNKDPAQPKINKIKFQNPLQIFKNFNFYVSRRFFLFIVELVYKNSLPEREIFANHIPDKVLISKIYKEPLKLNNNKKIPL